MLTLVDHVLYEALPYGFFVLGLVLTFRYLRLIDLTFAASFSLAPSLMAWALGAGWGFLPGVTLGFLATASLAGLTVLLIQKLEVDGLLAGIVASFAGYAVAVLFTRGSVSLRPYETPFQTLKDLDFGFLSGVVPLHPYQVAAFLLLVGIAKLLTDRFLNSEMGLAFRAMEDTESADHLLPSLGFSPERFEAAGIVLGNLFCGLSGLLVALKETQVTANRGFDALITVITAYLLGTTLFEKRPSLQPNGVLGRVIHSLRRLRVTTAGIVGLLFYYTVLYGVSLFDVPASAPKLLVAALLILSFALSRVAERRPGEGRLDGVRTRYTSDGPLKVLDADVAYPGHTGPIEIIKGANLDVKPGSLVQLSGANGAGKSTLLKFITGQIPGSGELVLPRPDDKEPDDRREAVAYISQSAAATTCGTLSSEEHLAIYRTAQGASPWKPWRRKNGLGGDEEDPPPLRLFDEIRDTPVGVLSGGQRQIMNIGSLVLRQDAPEVVLFDEPLTHLDEANARRCVDLISALRDQGRRLVIVQHDLESAEHYDNPDSSRARLARMVDFRVTVEGLQREQVMP